jgi:hypothetical protein
LRRQLDLVEADELDADAEVAGELLRHLDVETHQLLAIVAERVTTVVSSTGALKRGCIE